MSIYQDWEPVVFKKAKKSNEEYKQNAPGTKELRKLLEDDIPVVSNYSVEHSSKLIQMRNMKGIDRKQLAFKLNVNIKEIEAIENRSGKFNKVFFNKVIKFLEKQPDKQLEN